MALIQSKESPAILASSIPIFRHSLIPRARASNSTMLLVHICNIFDAARMKLPSESRMMQPKPPMLGFPLVASSKLSFHLKNWGFFHLTSEWFIFHLSGHDVVFFNFGHLICISTSHLVTTDFLFNFVMLLAILMMALCIPSMSWSVHLSFPLNICVFLSFQMCHMIIDGEEIQMLAQRFEFLNGQVDMNFVIFSCLGQGQCSSFWIQSQPLAATEHVKKTWSIVSSFFLHMTHQEGPCMPISLSLSAVKHLRWRTT